MKNYIYVLETQSQGLFFTVYVNDIPVASDRIGNSKTNQLKLNPFVIEGENRISVDMQLPSNTSADSKDLASPGFHLRLMSGELGMEPGPEGLKAEYIWQVTDAELQVTTPKPVWQSTFTGDPAFGRWAWQDATPYSEADHQAVINLLKETHTALSTRDINQLNSLLELKTKEMARALGIDSAMMSSGQNDFFVSYFNDKDWKMESFEPSKLTLTPSAGGRLVSVTNSAGNPPLQGFAGQRPFVMDVVVSHINGKWKIVR